MKALSFILILVVFLLSFAKVEAQRRKIAWSDTSLIAFSWEAKTDSQSLARFQANSYDVVSYYGYQINPQTGGSYETELLRDFVADSFVQRLQGQGCRAFIHVFIEENQLPELLDSNNTEATQVLIQKLSTLVTESQADGIDLYLPGLKPEFRLPYLRLIAQLSRALRELKPLRELWLVLPAYNEGGVYRLQELKHFCDRFVLLANSFHSTPTGPRRRPLAPLYTGVNTGTYDLRLSIEQYLKSLGSIPSQYLLLALPLYGSLWKIEKGKTRLSEMLTLSTIYEDYLSTDEGRNYLRYDSLSTSSVWQQIDLEQSTFIYFDDTASLRQKSWLLHEYRLGGLAWWMPSYAAELPQIEQLWQNLVLEGLEKQAEKEPFPVAAQEPKNNEKPLAAAAEKKKQIPETEPEAELVPVLTEEEEEEKPVAERKKRPEKEEILQNRGQVLILQFPRQDSLDAELYEKLQNWWDALQTQQELLLEVQDGRRPIHITGLLISSGANQETDNQAWMRSEQVAQWLSYRLGSVWGEEKKRHRLILSLQRDRESRSVGRVRVELGN